MKGKKVFMFCPPAGPISLQGRETETLIHIIKKINSIIDNRGELISLWLIDRPINTASGGSMLDKLVRILGLEPIDRNDKSYNDISKNFNWLTAELNNSSIRNFIIIADSEYIKHFAMHHNFIMKREGSEMWAGPGPLEGLLIDDGVLSDFSFRN
jgi:hypothetical protein